MYASNNATAVTVAVEIFLAVQLKIKISLPHNVTGHDGEPVLSTSPPQKICPPKFHLIKSLVAKPEGSTLLIRGSTIGNGFDAVPSYPNLTNFYSYAPSS
jgi:hypothetical protein